MDEASYLAGVLHVDVIDEFTEEPEVLLTARPQNGLLLKVLHLKAQQLE